MAETATRQNVLEQLDQRVPTKFYWSLTLLATIGGFLFGYDTANIGSALNFIPYKMGDFELGYLVAGTSLGAAAGALSAGPLTDRFGRRALLIVDALIYALGAVLMAFTPNVGVLLFARTLIGLAIGADSAIATAYISEYAPRTRRGSLGMLQQWMITVGILFAYLVALVILWAMPGSATTLDWRLLFGLGALPAVIGLVLRFEMPESPRWLMRKARYDDTRKAFAKLGMDVSPEDVEYTARQLEQTDQRQERVRKRGWSPGVRRALMVVCGFFVFQQVTGINVPFYYGPKLLGSYFQSGNGEVATTTAGVEVTTIMTVVNVAATYFAFRHIDRIGRRKLALGGFGGMAVSALIAAAGVGLMTGIPRIVVTMIGLAKQPRSAPPWTGWRTTRSSRRSRHGSARSAWAGCSCASPCCAWSRSCSSIATWQRQRACPSKRSASSSRARLPASARLAKLARTRHGDTAHPRRATDGRPGDRPLGRSPGLPHVSGAPRAGKPTIESARQRPTKEVSSCVSVPACSSSHLARS